MHLWMYSLWTNHNRRRLKVLFSPEIREGGGEGEKGKHCPQKRYIFVGIIISLLSWLVPVVHLSPPSTSPFSMLHHCWPAFLIAAAQWHVQCFLCHSFTHQHQQPGSHNKICTQRDRRSAFVTAPLHRNRHRSTLLPSTHSSTELVTSSSPYKVLANCPELGGDIIRIRTGPDDDDVDDAGYITSLGVPTFAVLPPRLQQQQSAFNEIGETIQNLQSDTLKPKRLGLEGVLHQTNAFVLSNALSATACESILNTCEHALKFGEYNAGKNNHGAMQIVVSQQTADALLSVIGPHVDLEGVVESELDLQDNTTTENTPENRKSYSIAGINRRFRVYRYAPDEKERFAPHIDAGFPPGGVSFDDENNGENSDDRQPHLHWDATHQYSQYTEVVSRLTVLIYLNEDFSGGSTKFYSPQNEKDRAASWNGGVSTKEHTDANVIAAIQPRTGSILVFPQAISEEAVERARQIWPLHEGSPVTSGNRPKYVIRTDVLFETNKSNEEEIESLPEEDRVLFEHDGAVRRAFLPTSPAFSSLFLHHVQPLYNPHMGGECVLHSYCIKSSCSSLILFSFSVENVGPLLYSLVRFTKRKRIVEIGAGYTTLWLLQALKDNDDEMKRVVDLNKEGRLRMLDYPFGTPCLNDWETSSPSFVPSSLLCIDNCEHQRETASGAMAVARTLGLDSYIEFLQGDAFDALGTHFSQNESIDLLWCDFGVGSRIAEYASNVWQYIKPGGFFLCHSTLTNARTREWLEAVRYKKSAEVTGIPPDECVEVSLLEHHKKYQNSITILQKRIGKNGRYEEPLYSEYA